MGSWDNKIDSLPVWGFYCGSQTCRLGVPGLPGALSELRRNVVGAGVGREQRDDIRNSLQWDQEAVAMSEALSKGVVGGD